MKELLETIIKIIMAGILACLALVLCVGFVMEFPIASVVMVMILVMLLSSKDLEEVA